MIKESFLKKNKAFKYFKILVFGSSASFIINAISLYFFSKLYSKEQFGVYALFVSFITLGAILSAFRLNDVIVLQKTKKEAAYISYVCTKITLYFSILILIFTTSFGFLSISFFSANYKIWFYISGALYCLSIIGIFLAWNNKIKRYKVISVYRLIQAINLAVFGILFGFFNIELGLILAYTISVVISSIYLWVKFKSSIKIVELKKITVYGIKLILLKNRDIVNYSFGLSFFTTALKTLPNFILNSFYGSGIVGVYDMSLKILNIPINLISTNIGELYYQKGSVFHTKYKLKFKKLTVNSIMILFLVAIFSYLPFILYGEELFSIFLGNKWAIAGVFSEVMSLWYIILFTTSPMAYIFYIKRELYKLFWFIFISFFVKISILFYLVKFYAENDVIYLYTYICISLELLLLLSIIRNTFKDKKDIK